MNLLTKLQTYETKLQTALGRGGVTDKWFHAVQDKIAAVDKKIGTLKARDTSASSSTTTPPVTTTPPPVTQPSNTTILPNTPADPLAPVTPASTTTMFNWQTFDYSKLILPVAIGLGLLLVFRKRK